MLKLKQLNSRGFSHHFILPVLVIVAIGGIGTYILSQSKAAIAPNKLVYSLVSRDSSVDGVHIMKSDGTDTNFGRFQKIHDRSDDGNWILVTKTDTGVNKIGAISTQTQEFKEYFTSTNIGCGSQPEARVQDQIAAKFVPSFSPDVPPAIYYSITTQKCDGLVTQSSAVYRLGVGGQHKKTVLKSDVNGTGFYLNEVANNETLAINKYAEKEYKYTAVFITKAGKKYTYADSYDPSVSMNGKRILLNYNFSDYYIANLDGSAKTRLKLGDGSNSRVTMNSDGTQVVYTKDKGDNKLRLFVYTVRNDNKTLLDTVLVKRNSEPSESQYFSWSKNDSQIAYEIKNTIDKKYQLRVISKAGNDRQTVKTFDYANTNSVVPYWR